MYRQNPKSMRKQGWEANIAPKNKQTTLEVEVPYNPS